MLTTHGTIVTRSTCITSISLEMRGTFLATFSLEPLGTFCAVISLEPLGTFCAVISLEPLGTFFTFVSLEIWFATLTPVSLETISAVTSGGCPGRLTCSTMLTESAILCAFVVFYSITHRKIIFYIPFTQMIIFRVTSNNVLRRKLLECLTYDIENRCCVIYHVSIVAKAYCHLTGDDATSCYDIDC